MNWRLTFIAVVMLAAVLMTAFVCQAGSVTCAWDPNTEADLAGYRLFQRIAGAAYDYAAPVAEIPAGTEICTLADIPDGDYRWVLRAFDTANNESADSNEVALFIDDPPDTVTGFG